MAVRGTVAKDNVIEKIKQAFGQDYIGIFDKKVYVFAEDENEKVQIAISLTCPKAPIAVKNENTLSYNEGIDFENNSVVINEQEPAKISDEERELIRDLMKKMGL